MEKMFSIKEVMKSKEFQKDAPGQMKFLVPRVLRENEQRGRTESSQQQKETKKKNAA